MAEAGVEVVVGMAVVVGTVVVGTGAVVGMAAVVALGSRSLGWGSILRFITSISHHHQPRSITRFLRQEPMHRLHPPPVIAR